MGCGNSSGEAGQKEPRSDAVEPAGAEQGADGAAPGAGANSAFVFIKPHAVTDGVKQLVRDTLAARGVRIRSEGAIQGPQIDDKRLIDQHYYSIASKATILKPRELNVPAEKFEAKFGMPWQEALGQGVVMNALDACEHLGVSADGLEQLWSAAKDAGEFAKFGGGFYCARLRPPEHDPVLVFNGFFMTMRSKYTAPGAGIHWFLVDWSPSDLPWRDFRAQLLGPTDPKDAPPESLRGMVLARWKELGLPAEPNVSDNGLHASAGPFEALAERANWLGEDPQHNPFGEALISAGVTAETIAQWSRDPQVKLSHGTFGSLFDALEDLDTAECVVRAAELAAAQPAAKL